MASASLGPIFAPVVVVLQLLKLTLRSPSQSQSRSRSRSQRRPASSLVSSRRLPTRTGARAAYLFGGHCPRLLIVGVVVAFLSRPCLAKLPLIMAPCCCCCYCRGVWFVAAGQGAKPAASGGSEQCPSEREIFQWVPPAGLFVSLFQLGSVKLFAS